jgi:hypothetical protein
VIVYLKTLSTFSAPGKLIFTLPKPVTPVRRTPGTISPPAPFSPLALAFSLVPSLLPAPDKPTSAPVFVAFVALRVKIFPPIKNRIIVDR